MVTQAITITTVNTVSIILTKHHSKTKLRDVINAVSINMFVWFLIVILVAHSLALLKFMVIRIGGRLHFIRYL